MINFCSFYNFPRVWEFFKLSTHPYMNLATVKSIFNSQLLLVFIYFSIFAFWRAMGIFQALKLALPSFCPVFSNSVICQIMLENGTGQFPIDIGLDVSICSSDLLLGSCPTWALGNCPSGCIHVQWQLPMFRVR